MSHCVTVSIFGYHKIPQSKPSEEIFRGFKVADFTEESGGEEDIDEDDDEGDEEDEDEDEDDEDEEEEVRICAQVA